MRTFAGLMSRCTTPWRCAWSSAAATSRAMRSVCGTGMRPVVVEERAQRGPVDELHDDVGDVAVLAGVVGRDDVGVAELGRGDRFAAEPGPQPVVERQLGVEGLDRDAPREQDVVADPHRGHPATCDRADEPVAVAEDPPGWRQPDSPAPRYRRCDLASQAARSTVLEGHADDPGPGVRADDRDRRSP